MESNPFQQLAKNEAIFRTVVDNQKAISGLTRQKSNRMTIRLFGMYHCTLGQVDRNIKREDAAPPDLAADGDFHRPAALQT